MSIYNAFNNENLVKLKLRERESKSQCKATKKAIKFNEFTTQMLMH